MKAEVMLREFEFPQDYPEVLAMWRLCEPGIHIGQSDSPDQIAQKMRRDPDLFLVAEVNQQIVGTVLGGFDGRRGMMYHLAVAPDFRNQGIASQLVAELESRLRAKGCIRYYLLAIDDNLPAIDFYEKRGFSQIKVLAYGKDLG
jgi:ribosomal protein S18 acetylase RimI-like enzyme